MKDIKKLLSQQRNEILPGNAMKDIIKQKRLEKRSINSLGPGCREFESRHSDHLRTQSLIQWLCTEIFFYYCNIP